MPLLAVVVLIIFIKLFLVLWDKDAAFKDNPLGKRQFGLIKTYTKAETVLFYIDQSAQFSLSQSAYELANNGGISEIEVSDVEGFAGYECGKFNDAYVWYQVEKQGDAYIPKKCFDDSSPETNLKYLFDQKLDQYLLKHPYNIPTENYKYEFKNNLEIIGNAVYPIKFDIFKKEIPEDFSAYQNEQSQTKPIDAKQFDRQVEKTPDGLRDFTGSDLCAKGSRCALKEEPFQNLLQAEKAAEEKKLCKGICLEVYSAYRSKAEQEKLWNGDTPERYADRYIDPAVRIKYVCDPKGGEKACPHMSGKVGDIRLKGKTTSTMTSADWNNLYSVMTSPDPNKQPLWVRYSNEPWHFECCNTNRYARAIEKGATSIV